MQSFYHNTKYFEEGRRQNVKNPVTLKIKVCYAS